jgi:hypothetical protein
MALNAEEYEAKEAKKRQATSTGGSKPQLKEKIPEAEKGKKPAPQARDKAAEIFSTTSVCIVQIVPMGTIWM